MKNIRKALSLILALVMTLSLSVSAMAAEYPAVMMSVDDFGEDLTGKTMVLHTNDVHGQIDAYAYIAALRTEFEKRGAEVVLVDAGDFSQGDPNVSVSKGATAVEMMNAVGYDIVTLGNHEFDYGYAQLKENLKNAKFEVVCANILENGKAAFAPCVIGANEKGEKVNIGFFGLDTPEAQTKTNPALIQGLTFLSNSNGKTDLYDCAKQTVKTLKDNGADIIIGLWHLGVDDESAPDGHRSLDVLAKVDGIDFVIDGHSHTVMTSGENHEPIQSTGTKLVNIGVIKIDNATKKIEASGLIETKVKDNDGNVVSELAKDETVAAAAKKIMDEIDAKYGAVFAKSEVELNGERDPGNRTEETNNGDLITDAMRWTVLKNAGSVTVDADHVVAITNGGGIRAAIKVGDVTMKDINTVLPFGNTVAVVYVTGAELLEALEASTYSLPQAVGGYPQTAGIKFTLDTNKAYDAKAETYPGSTYYGPKSIQRVTIESINGKDFDEKATYAVVTNDFCAAGGDTYYAFAAASAQFDTGIPMDEAVMDYIETELKGVITAEKYGQPRGDQTIKVDLLAKYTDVNTAAWYAPALRYAIENKIQTGTSDTEFSPDMTLTRAQVIKTIANMAGEDTTPAEGEKWYDKAVAWAVENKISDGKNPDAPSTREDFVTMLYNYLKMQGKGSEGEGSSPLDFPDAGSLSEGAIEAMHWMVTNKIITGMTTNSDALMLNPQGTTTRAQFAQVLLNLSVLGIK